MAIIGRTFNTIPGQTTLSHFSLFGARIYGVARSGDIYNEIPAAGPAAASLEFRHISATLQFDPANPFNAGEKVWVLYD